MIKSKAELFIILALVIGMTFMVGVIVDREYHIKSKEIRINEQSDLIRDMTVITQAYDELIVIHEELKRNTQIIASLSPLKDIVSVDEINELIKHIPHGSPFRTRFHVTAEFGLSKGMFNIVRYNHLGTDMIPEVPEDMDWTITPLSEGRVVAYGLDEIHGKNVTIQHNVTTRTRYSHLSKIYYAGTTGNEVTEDTAIGEMGDTGESFGKHLHFEVLVRVGDYWVPINGLPFLENK